MFTQLQRAEGTAGLGAQNRRSAEVEAPRMVVGSSGLSGEMSQRLAQLRIQNMEETLQAADHQRVTASSPHKVQRGLIGVVDSSVDDGPDGLVGVDDGPSVVDCGASGEFVGSDTPPRVSPPRERIDPRLDPGQGGKPFLLPVRPDAEAGRPHWPQQPLGAGDVGGQQTEMPTPPRMPGTNAEEPEVQESMLQQLQDEMGFSRYQVTEAFKRCSTAEAAIDWILDPAREWDSNWSA
jgi:hypothetical protein